MNRCFTLHFFSCKQQPLFLFCTKVFSIWFMQNALRQQRFVREVTIQYNLCNEPWYYSDLPSDAPHFQFTKVPSSACMVSFGQGPILPFLSQTSIHVFERLSLLLVEAVLLFSFELRFLLVTSSFSFINTIKFGEIF